MTASVRWEVTDAAGVPYQIVVEQVDTREWTDSKPTTFYAAQIGDWPAVGSLRCVMRNERAAVVSVALTAGIEIATVRRCDDEQLADARARVVDTLTSLRAPKSAKILVRHGLLDGAAADLHRVTMELHAARHLADEAQRARAKQSLELAEAQSRLSRMESALRDAVRRCQVDDCDRIATVRGLYGVVRIYACDACCDDVALTSQEPLPHADVLRSLDAPAGGDS